jgi:hypothetical protein
MRKKLAKLVEMKYQMNRQPVWDELTELLEEVIGRIEVLEGGSSEVEVIVPDEVSKPLGIKVKEGATIEEDEPDEFKQISGSSFAPSGSEN